MNTVKKNDRKQIYSLIAVIFFTIGIILEIVELIFQIIDKEINAFNVGSFILHFTFYAFLTFGLFSRKDKITDIGLMVLKVFDGVFYPLLALQRIDKFRWNTAIGSVEIITFLSAAIMVFLVLFFFICEKIKPRKIYWHLVIVFLFLSAISILANFISMCIDANMYQKIWTTGLESGYLCLLFSGMIFATLSVGFQHDQNCK